MQAGFAQVGLIKTRIVDPSQGKTAAFNKDRLAKVAIAEVGFGEIQVVQLSLVEGQPRQDGTAQHAVFEHEPQGRAIYKIGPG